MRMGFGLIGLLVALAIVALLAKKQLGAARVATPSAVPGRAMPAANPPATTARAQSQQVQQQVREQMDALMQQPRRLPDDAH